MIMICVLCIVKEQGFISPVDTGRQRARTPSPSDSQLLLSSIYWNAVGCRNAETWTWASGLAPAQLSALFPANPGASTVYL